MHHDENQNDVHATETTDHGNPAHDQSLAESILGLQKLGRLWAAHGLRAGVAALQTSAVTLTQVASTLALLAEGIKVQQQEVEDDDRPRA